MPSRFLSRILIALVCAVLACPVLAQGADQPPLPPEGLAVTNNGETLLVTWEDWLAGDHNLDGVVNGQDVFLLAARFGQTSGFNGNVEQTPGNDCIDANMDGVLSGLDLFPVSAGFLNELDAYHVHGRYAIAGEMQRLTIPEGVAYEGCRSVGEFEFTPDETPVWIAASASNAVGEGPLGHEVMFGDVWSVELGGGVAVDFVWVRPGEVMLGSPDGEFERREREGPYQQVELPGFFILATEVTNAQYERFMLAGGYSNDDWWTYGADWRDTEGVSAPLYWDTGEFNSGPSFPDYPVNGVSWYEAAAFSSWLTELSGHEVRLPTEAEWERAAEGSSTDGEYKLYPWGDVGGDNDGYDGLDTANANSWHDTDPDTFEHSSPAGFFTGGASPFGALDMAGNLWEWTEENWREEYPLPWDTAPFEDDRDDPAIRSGSFSREAGDLRCSYRNSAPVETRESDLGFRPVRID